MKHLFTPPLKRLVILTLGLLVFQNFNSHAQCAGQTLQSAFPSSFSGNQLIDDISGSGNMYFVDTDIEIPINSDIILEDCILNIDQGIKITIKEGSLVRIKDCSFDKCEPANSQALWKGIFAEGNPSISQEGSGNELNDNQTRLYVENSTIKYAEVGLWLGQEDPAYSLAGGAVLRARDNNFEDCLKAVVFNEYAFENYN